MTDEVYCDDKECKFNDMGQFPKCVKTTVRIKGQYCIHDTCHVCQSFRLRKKEVKQDDMP